LASAPRSRPGAPGGGPQPAHAEATVADLADIGLYGVQQRRRALGIAPQRATRTRMARSSGAFDKPYA
jgi:hypothetical protein